MIYSLRWILFAAVAIMALPGPCALAQAAPGASSDSTCPYDACALRLSHYRVIAGVRARVVADPGIFTAGDAFVAAFARSDSAIAYARQFARTYNRTQWLALLASAGFGASLGLMTGRAIEDGGVPSELVYSVVGSAAIGLYARTKLRIAENHLSRAVWWYNRSLARQ